MKIGISVALVVAATQWLALSTAQEYVFTTEQKQNANRTLSIGYVSITGSCTQM